MQLQPTLRSVILLVVSFYVGSPLVSTSAVFASSDEPMIDGLLDHQYVFLKNIKISESDSGVLYAPGTLYSFEGSTVCYWSYVVDRAYNSNVYAESDPGYLQQEGWTQAHNFGHLEHSDHAKFTIEYGDGQSFLIGLNYLNVQLNLNGEQEGPQRRHNYVQPPAAESGTADDRYSFGSTQFTPRSPHLRDAATSLYWNLLNSGWQQSDGVTDIEAFTLQSPPFNYNETSDHYWEWHMIYEWSVAKSEMGGVCGTISEALAGAHNSPAKELGSSIFTTNGNYVWLDRDRDGIQNNATQDDPNAGIGNVTVYLRNASTDAIIRTTQTAPSGYYIFNNVPSGSYYVDFKLPSGYAFTIPNEGDDDAIDSDADVTNGHTPSFDVGQSNLTLDAGLVADLAGLGDYVWFDTNYNALQDSDEPGINGVMVNLLQGNSVISTTVTDDTGHYWFAGLQPSRYSVEFVPQAGQTLTTANAQNNSHDATDSDAVVPNVEATVSDGGIEPRLGEILSYTIGYNNTDDTLSVANLTLSAVVPDGTSFLTANSTNNWICAGGAITAGTVCTMSIDNLSPKAIGSVLFVVQLGLDAQVVPEILGLDFEFISSATGKSDGMTLGAGEENNTVDAGMIAKPLNKQSILTPRNTTSTGTESPPLPTGQREIYLPAVEH